MNRARDKRLKRLSGRHDAAEKELYHWRAERESRLKFCDVLRQMLAALGIDPAEVKMPKVCDEAKAELAAGPPPALVRAAQPPRGYFEKEMERLAQSYRDDLRIDLAKAPLAQVFAWCLARLDIAPDEIIDHSSTAANPLQKQR